MEINFQISPALYMQQGVEITELKSIKLTIQRTMNVTWFFPKNLIKRLFNLFWHSIVKIDHGFAFFFETVGTVFTAILNHQGDRFRVNENARPSFFLTTIRKQSKKDIDSLKKQLFFEIEENTLPLFTEIETNNCFGSYAQSVLNNTISQHMPKKTIQSR